MGELSVEEVKFVGRGCEDPPRGDGENRGRAVDWGTGSGLTPNLPDYSPAS